MRLTPAETERVVRGILASPDWSALLRAHLGRAYQLESFMFLEAVRDLRADDGPFNADRVHDLIAKFVVHHAPYEICLPSAVRDALLAACETHDVADMSAALEACEAVVCGELRLEPAFRRFLFKHGAELMGEFATRS